MKPINVLDHGHVTLVEHWGSDERIIEAARMSTQKGFEGWGPRECKHCKAAPLPPIEEIACIDGKTHDFSGDEKLLAYLWKNHHATPFEMAGMTVEVQAPIFVFREWHRHRTQSYNEMSARYTPLPDLNYIPTVERLLAGGGHLTKQAAGVGDVQLNADTARRVQQEIKDAYYSAQRDYASMLATGAPKELARLVLPVGRYSRMRASANLRNWLGFLTLRMEASAQWEIRQYANAAHDIAKELFPRTVALFDEGTK